jgi:D-aminoacyl-tRNA deacylase
MLLMRVVIQRVSEARVEVDGKVTGAIGKGLLVLLGVAQSDTERDADYLLDKVLGLRIFPDQTGKMNHSLVEAGGSLLIVSQFTLYADCRKGRRPNFDAAAPAASASRLYEYFVNRATMTDLLVRTGVFQAMMQVHLINDGPVTIIMDSVSVTSL